MRTFAVRRWSAGWRDVARRRAARAIRAARAATPVLPPARAPPAARAAAIVAGMAPLALALQLALAAAPGPSLAPPLDPGRSFRGAELALASVGVLAGDAAVLGGGYLTLQLFAQGAFSPDATSFRRAAYVLAGTALLVPPLTAVLLARLSGRGAGAGTFWKGLLLASVGHLTALGAGYLAAPHFWVMLPVQLVAVAAGTSLGFHWARSSARRASPSLPPKPSAAPPLPTATGGGEPDEPPPATSLFPLSICPDA